MSCRAYGPRNLTEIELWVQPNSHAFDHQEELQEHGHLLRQLQVVLPQQRQQVGRQVRDVNLAQATTSVEADESDQVYPELVPIDWAALPPKAPAVRWPGVPRRGR